MEMTGVAFMRVGAAAVGIITTLVLSTAGELRAAERKVVVQGGSPAPNLGYVQLYIAQEAGFFKEEGLEVSVQYGQGAFLAMQLAATGKVDIAQGSIEPVILGYEKGLRGKFFYQYNTRLIYYVGVPADGSLQTVADLRGKRIGVPNLGTAIIPVVRSQLKDAGVPVDQVTFLPVGIGEQAATALRAGQVDALGLWDPAFAALESTGMKFRYFVHPKLRDVGNAGYFASDGFLKENPDVVRRFARAVAKGTVFAFASPEAAVRIFWKVSPAARGGGNESEALSKAADELRFVFKGFSIEGSRVKKYGHVEAEGWQRYFDVLQAEGFLKVKPPINDVLTNAHVDFANEFDVEAVKGIAKKWSAK